MNKKILLLSMPIALLASAIAYADCSCDCKTTSHSTFVGNQNDLYLSASPARMASFRDRLDANHKEDKWAGAFQATLFGGKSTEEEKLARFFFPFCKTELSVSNDISKNPDLLAQQFNIYTAYEGAAITQPEAFDSKISICPSQSFVGLGLTWKQGFWHREEKDLWMWFEISMPITHFHNKMCLKETITDGEDATFIDTDLPHNMTEALRQSSWCYGKIIDDCCTTNCNPTCCDNSKNCMEKTAVADIEAKIGYEWFNTESCFFESYVGALIPTGNCPKATYMFEPVVGHNKHAGVFIGSTSIVEVWHSDCTDSEIDFVTDGYGLYLFGKCERRPFDLKYRPWSRYMQVYANKAQAEEAEALAQAGNINEALMLHTPGINVFTKDLYVEPRFVAISNFAIFANYKAWQTEVGYNFYARAAECVELNSCWDKEVALKAIFPADINHGGYTNPVQTIGTSFATTFPSNQPMTVVNYDQNIITASDLDLESAAHPAVFTHTVYGALSYRWDDYKYPWFLGIGGSYEYSDENTGLTRWMGWAKAGVSF